MVGKPEVCVGDLIPCGAEQGRGADCFQQQLTPSVRQRQAVV